jgi:choline dehydrogenase-like flavoprotein
LEQDGRLTIACKTFEPSGDVLAALTRRLGMMGALTHPKLISPLPPGGAMHYAGTLPMKKCPGEFECFPDGRLSGSTRVFIADGANFSHLPAKNNSLTIMANSMRITDRLIDRASSVDVES